MVRISSPWSMCHLGQRLANDGHLAELVQKSHQEMDEPTRREAINCACQSEVIIILDSRILGSLSPLWDSRSALEWRPLDSAYTE